MASSIRRWFNDYQVWLDGKPTDMMVIGANKKEAWADFAKREWRLVFPGQPMPPRRRFKLVAVASWWE